MSPLLQFYEFKIKTVSRAATCHNTVNLKNISENASDIDSFTCAAEELILSKAGFKVMIKNKKHLSLAVLLDASAARKPSKHTCEQLGMA